MNVQTDMSVLGLVMTFVLEPAQIILVMFVWRKGVKSDPQNSY